MISEEFKRMQELAGVINEMPKIMNPNKKVNFESIEIDDVDDNDYPDFSNAYVSYAEYTDGTPLTKAELEKFENENYGIAQEIALENY